MIKILVMGSLPIDGAGTRCQLLPFLMSQSRAFTAPITDMAGGPPSSLLGLGVRLSSRQLIHLDWIENSDSPCIEGVLIHKKGLAKTWLEGDARQPEVENSELEKRRKGLSYPNGSTQLFGANWRSSVTLKMPGSMLGDSTK